MSDWIDWIGGERPLHPDTHIEVRYRAGGTATGCAGDWGACWSNDSDPGDIIAYRVLPDANGALPADLAKNAATLTSHIKDGPLVRAANVAGPVPVPALARQEGGGHYKDMKIQPFEYIHANGIGFAEGCVIKYVSRWKAKNGIEDLKKALHFLELLIEAEAKGE